MSARNVTGLLDTLQRDGLIERAPDPDDRRSIRATITPAGSAWLDAFRKPSQLGSPATFQRPRTHRTPVGTQRTAEHFRLAGSPRSSSSSTRPCGD